VEPVATPAGGASSLDAALLAAGARRAAEATAAAEPARAIDAAVGVLHEAVRGIFPSVFVLDHGRLWLVAQRGYAVVPDGIRIERGVMGRAVRLGTPQHSDDVRSDPDYVPALPGIGCELAVPLRVGELVVGALNIEAECPLPTSAADLLQPLASALAPLVEALGHGQLLDLPALARLFVHLGSLRDPDEIAGIAAASISKVLPVETSQVLVWDEQGGAVELASWQAAGGARELLRPDEIKAARTLVDPNVICQLLDVGAQRPGGRGPAALVWLPLRASGVEVGAIVAAGRPDEGVDPVQLDTAAVLAAHVAASLDSAFAFQRERRSALTDPLTGVLNRRGLEERLEDEIGSAQQRRLPLSLLVIDCDDFKEINDRAGHEFGDALLQEVTRVLTRSLPRGAEAARLGGDEFVVMLPRAGVEEAAALGEEIRGLLAAGLTHAGFPLRISAGVATYPFDGATPTALLRTADQALYAAKNAGKDRIATFRDVVRPDAIFDAAPARSDSRRRRGGGGAATLAEVVDATAALDGEDTVEGICDRLCRALVFTVGATACSASTLSGDYLVETTEYSLRDVWLGDDVAYRVGDFPLTAEVLETGEPRAVSFLDEDVEPAQAFVLRELGMNALLLLALRVGGTPWGLVELYEMRLRRFSEDEVAAAHLLTAHAERRLEEIGAVAMERSAQVYELPRADDPPRGPRTR
jgi:diguanylate cyclase (GGDEF)-like protein